MRYLIDTNIFIYLATDADLLCNDAKAILSDYNNVLLMSSESVKELIVAYRKHRFDTRRWHSPLDLVNAISNEFFIRILPADAKVMKTYASL